MCVFFRDYSFDKLVKWKVNWNIKFGSILKLSELLGGVLFVR